MCARSINTRHHRRRISCTVDRRLTVVANELFQTAAAEFVGAEVDASRPVETGTRAAGDRWRRWSPTEWTRVTGSACAPIADVTVVRTGGVVGAGKRGAETKVKVKVGTQDAGKAGVAVAMKLCDRRRVQDTSPASSTRRREAPVYLPCSDNFHMFLS